MPFKKCIFNVYGDYFITNSFIIIIVLYMISFEFIYMHDMSKLFKNIWNFNLTIRAQLILFFDLIPPIPLETLISIQPIFITPQEQVLRPAQV
jgi:hypothetical protein